MVQNFKYRVRIRNIIGGAAGAHISMTSYTFTHVWFPSRKTPVYFPSHNIEYLMGIRTIERQDDWRQTVER